MTDVTATPPTHGRPWLDAALPLEERIDLLLAEMTLAEKVGQTHQVANINPDDDAAEIASGRISSSLYASGATAGNERDEGVLVGNIDAAQRHAVEGSRLGIPLLFGRRATLPRGRPALLPRPRRPRDPAARRSDRLGARRPGARPGTRGLLRRAGLAIRIRRP